MGIVLKLLDDVRWRGTPVVGERRRALLAALAAGNGRPVRREELIELVWGEEIPANATKSLQVLVSRTRSACGEEAIVRDAVGYRLGVKPVEVDSVQLGALVREARAALALDAAGAAALAREAITLAAGLLNAPAEDAGPLSEIRRGANDDAGAATVLLARALSRTGRHAEAEEPLIDAACERPLTRPCLPICCVARRRSWVRPRHWSAMRATGGSCASGSARTPASCCNVCSGSCLRSTSRSVAACATTPPRCSAAMPISNTSGHYSPLHASSRSSGPEGSVRPGWRTCSPATPGSRSSMSSSLSE